MEDPSGYIAWWIVGAGIGAVAGAIAGAVYSYKTKGSVDWRYVAGGALAGALVGAGLGYAAETAYAAMTASGAVASKIADAKEMAVQRAAQLRDILSKRKLPMGTSAAVDRTTGNVYYGNSGTISNNINKVLQARMPNPSLQKWPVANCAEFNAVNNALNSGAKITNLDVATVVVKTGQAFPMCKNCQITIFGANVLTK